MIRLVLLIFMVFLFEPSMEQNLIQNGSFENYSEYNSKDEHSGIQFCTGWEMSNNSFIGNTPNLFVSTDTGSYLIKWQGSVVPHSGVACAGFVMCEYLIQPFETKMKNDSLYEISFWYCLSSRSDYYTNVFAFSFIPADSFNFNDCRTVESQNHFEWLTEFYPIQLRVTCDSGNSLQWRRFHFLYKAKGDEAGVMFGVQFLTPEERQISQFSSCVKLRPEARTKKLALGQDYNELYYFIDDVSIVPTKAPIETGKPVALYNILFDVGKSEIKPESFVYLDLLVDYFLSMPELHIEISGHTDNTGNNDENEKLSLARAIAVKRYFATKGVAADRISVKGYGASKLIADNNTAEGRAKNRRIEILLK